MLDRESSPGDMTQLFFSPIQSSDKAILFQIEITVTVEARDTEGTGRSATVPVIIRLQDINDNAPQFIGLPYETNLTPDLSRFTSKVIVQVCFV